MKIMMLGSPGVGKGTQAKFICEAHGIPQISTGDMLRAEIKSGSDFGHKMKQILDAGKLVPDELMIQIVKKRLNEPDCEPGFLLDGFPRTLAQAQALVDAGIDLEHVVIINASDEEVIKRLSGRRVHPASGRTYHVDFQPPQVPEQDDETGEPLVQRDDDMPDVIRHRLSVYKAETMPLVDFYHRLAKESSTKVDEIDGAMAIADVQQKISQLLA